MQDTARGVTVVPKTMQMEDCLAQVLYSNLIALERFLHQIGVSFHYRNGTVVFDDVGTMHAKAVHNGATDASGAHRSHPLEKLKRYFNQVATAHQWFCHREVTQLAYEQVNEAIKSIIENINPSDGFGDLVCHLTPLPAMQTSNGRIRVTIALRPAPGRMTVPVARATKLFGRQHTVDKLVKLLETTSGAPRVLVTGVSGVGKGAVCAEVVHSPRIQYRRHCACSCVQQDQMFRVPLFLFAHVVALWSYIWGFCTVLMCLLCVVYAHCMVHQQSLIQRRHLFSLSACTLWTCLQASEWTPRVGAGQQRWSLPPADVGGVQDVPPARGEALRRERYEVNGVDSPVAADNQ